LPAFEGTMITAGNAPGLSDGATAVLVTSRARAEAAGLSPLARIVTWAEAALEPPYMGEAPALAAERALERAGMKADQMKRSEVNEAFASVALSFIQQLGLDPETVNVNGGALAIGHPVGATGARILMTLAYELRRLGGGLGMAAICSGTAQGDACIIEASAG
jgi:acetyl-CoA C-acetyltransferase